MNIWHSVLDLCGSEVISALIANPAKKIENDIMTIKHVKSIKELKQVKT